MHIWSRIRLLTSACVFPGSFRRPSVQNMGCGLAINAYGMCLGRRVFIGRCAHVVHLVRILLVRFNLVLTLFLFILFVFSPDSSPYFSYAQARQDAHGSLLLY